MQFHKDVSLEERYFHNQLGYATCHNHSEMGIELPQIFIDNNANTFKVKQNIVVETKDGILKFPNSEYLQISTNSQESMDGWTKSKI